jgi:hypothetical protein
MKGKKQQQPLVRIDHADKVVLEQLSAKTGESTPRLLHRAVTQLKKQIFFDQMNSGYQKLRSDKAAWDAELEERALLDKTIGDGLSA